MPLSATVVAYEELIERILIPKIKAAEEERHRVYVEVQEYLELGNMLEVIDQHPATKLEPLKTKVDLGCDFHVQATVPDTSHIYVDVGFGFHVALTSDEARTFVKRKTEHLERVANKLTEKCGELRGDIKMALASIAEMEEGSVLG